MAQRTWDQNTGVWADSEGTLTANTFDGDLTNGAGTEQFSFDSGTNIFNTGSDTTSHFGGYVVMDALPIADPSTLGQLWNSNGTVKVSAG